jgi:dATP pyrophosphohydrolase
VLVVVFSDDGEVLLLKRRKPFEFWQSVTGALESDETPGDTARRELLEETGLTDEGELSDTGVTRQFTIDPRWRDRYAPGVSENSEHEWHYRLQTAVDVKLCGTEHSAFRWLDFATAIDTVWSWTNKDALRDLRAKFR